MYRQVVSTSVRALRTAFAEDKEREEVKLHRIPSLSLIYLVGIIKNINNGQHN